MIRLLPGLGALAVAGLAPGVVHGQAVVTIPPRYEIGVDASWSGSMSRAFSDSQICPSERAFSGGLRAGVRIMPRLRGEAIGQYYFGNGADFCVNGLLPPPPSEGPFTQRYSFHPAHVTGYGFWLTGLRALVVPLSGPSSELRLHGGVGRIISKKITMGETGASLVFGAATVRILTELSIWWYQVPRHDTTEEFQDGVSTSSRLDVTQVGERSVHLRLGLIFPMGP